MDVQEFLSQLSLLDYVRQYIHMEKRGNEWFGRCPFHEENTASFSVSEGENSQVYYCFGCGASGNLITFAQQFHHIPYRKALETLAKWGGLNESLVEPEKQPSARIISRRFMGNEKTDKKEFQGWLPENCMDEYEKDSSELSLWTDEGISAEAFARFSVRYDPRTRRILFPIRNNDGRIVGLSGRTTDPQWKEKGLRKYTYTSRIGSVDFLYGLSENRQEVLDMGELIVFEGAKSVMKAFSWGVRNCAALLTSHLNEAQMKVLAALGQPVVFALDKEIDISKDKNIMRLRQFVPVYTICDRANLLDEKDAPVDKGKEVFAILYEGRKKM